MAISFVQRGNNDILVGWASWSFSFTNPIAAGSIIVVAGLVDPAATAITISDDKSDAVTTVVPRTVGSNTAAAYFCSAFLTATTGAKTITVTATAGSPTYGDMFIWEIAGLTSAAVDKVANTGGVGLNADSGPTGTLSANAEAAIAYGTESVQFASGGSGWVNVNINGATGSIGEEQVTTVNTSINGTGTTAGSGDHWDMLVATFCEASALAQGPQGGSFFADNTVYGQPPAQRALKPDHQFATPAQPVPFLQNAAQPSAAGVAKVRMIPG